MINNPNKIYSKIITNPKKSHDEYYNELLTKFQSADSYSPLKFFNEIINDDSFPIITEKRIIDNVRVWVPVFISVIVGSFSILRFFVNFP